MENKEIKKEVEGMITKAVEEQTQINAEKIENLEKSAKEQSEILKSLNEKMVKKNAVPMSVRSDRSRLYKSKFKAAILENIEKFKSLRGSDQSVELVTKDYENEGDDIEAINTQVSFTPTTSTSVFDYNEIEAGTTRQIKRPLFMRDLVNVSPISGSFARWTEMTSSGSVTTVAEGGTKPEISVEWVQNNAPVKKIAALVKVSEECLEDIEFAAEDIAAELTEAVLLKEDEQILNGDGTGANMKGLMEYASTLTIGNTDDFYRTITLANHQDVLRVAIAKMQENNFMPNAVVINPVDAAKLDLTKTAIGDYVSLVVNNTLWQIQVIVNTGMEAGSFLIGDFTRSNYRVRKDISMLAGREGSDLKQNMFTIIAELRGAHYVKENHKNAFYKGTFATLITDIAGE